MKLAINSKHVILVLVIVICIFIVLYQHLRNSIAVLAEENNILRQSADDIQSGIDNLRLRLTASVDYSNSKIDISREQFSEDELLVIYNRVPKTASTSFMNIPYSLCGKRKYHVIHINTTRNAHVMSLADQIRFTSNISNWSSKKPALYHGHLAFLDFTRYGMMNPIYINIIREPLDRLVSYYYFLRYGDDFRPHLKRHRQGDTMTFDECVKSDGIDCKASNMWLQIPFFCGHFKQCWEVGSEWALDQAKRNVLDHYLLVGVTEQLQDFVNILEYTLPRFFKGATNLYISSTKSHLRKTFNKLNPSPDTVSKMQRTKVWHLENEFYQFIFQHFQYIKRKSLIIPPTDDTYSSTNVMLREKGKQFKYEKIKPNRL